MLGFTHLCVFMDLSVDVSVHNVCVCGCSGTDCVHNLSYTDFYKRFFFILYAFIGDNAATSCLKLVNYQRDIVAFDAPV